MEVASLIFSALGLVLSIASIVVAMRSNSHAKEANRISSQSSGLASEANSIAAASNEIAHRVERMQRAEAEVRLVVQPRMQVLVGRDADNRPRPVVRVINVSSFPVTIRAIGWKTSSAELPNLLWKNPIDAVSGRPLPIRIESRSAALFPGIPDWLPSNLSLESIVACVAFTDCDEEFEGMTEQWKDSVQRMLPVTKRDPPFGQET